MPAYARRHAASFGRALVMPNVLPPVASAAALEAYRAELRAAAPGLEPLMAFKLLPGMDGETVRGLAAAGALAGKYYPAGATTNSADGIADPGQAEEALDAMEELGLVLSVHGEDPAASAMEREAAFLPALELILARHPGLRVVLEHLASREALSFVLSGPERLAGTVTAHHLLLTMDDLLGEGLDPHLYCKPLLKTGADREALREAVLGGAGKLFFGSDSAPHPRAAKESRRAPAGIYSSPAALPALAALFEEAGALAELRGFVAGRGAAFYGLPAPSGSLELLREDWTVPEEADGAVPMLAGRRLSWRLGRIEPGLRLPLA